ncbi:lytic transglycosylase [Cellvibrio zantedeschiae]|uniref:Lytic transglycosylase n=2 Tax=Cellvibrio zantedeschiae TaxID=1237077 RepID=A0ABQ3B144_9GAMM|nr:lytic transglycosylase [Cellvibrio zantedeschiae]
MVSVTALMVGCDSLHLKPTPKSTANPTAEAAQHPITVTTTTPEERTYETVWERIRAGYSLPQTSNNAVDSQIRFYTSNKAYFYKITQQSEPFLHYVASEMQANGMPMELALLPFIESSYNPTAMSPNNAGMWQFGAATGRNFGLKQNNWYDGRKDVVASTDAAIRLLKKLYAKFDNDWLLAVAAYNAGDGAIQQAVDKNRRAGKPTDFWSLPLNKTTQGYIPQLLALSRIVADPNVYDFKLYPIADVPYFVKINVDSQINLADAAQNSSLDVSLLKKLNSGYKGWLTDPTEPRHVLVPVDAAATFKLQLDALPKVASTKWQEHVVKKGDNLDSIAKRYGANSAQIKSVNNIKGNNVAVGQHLQIPLSPTSSSADNNSALVIAEQTPPKQIERTGYYVVKSGENLWSIAKAQNLSVDRLAQLNNLTSKTTLKPGQKLVVIDQSIAKNSADSSRDSRKLNYTIKSGDTLGKIAAKYDVSVKQIMQWNKIKDETSIRPNQELIVLVDAKN